MGPFSGLSSLFLTSCIPSVWDPPQDLFSSYFLVFLLFSFRVDSILFIDSPMSHLYVVSSVCVRSTSIFSSALLTHCHLSLFLHDDITQTSLVTLGFLALDMFAAKSDNLFFTDRGCRLGHRVGVSYGVVVRMCVFMFVWKIQRI